MKRNANSHEMINELDFSRFSCAKLFYYEFRISPCFDKCTKFAFVKSSFHWQNFYDDYADIGSKDDVSLKSHEDVNALRMTAVKALSRCMNFSQFSFKGLHSCERHFEVFIRNEGRDCSE